MVTMEEIHSIQLRNAVALPLLGIGTTHSSGYVHESLVLALRGLKYRLIDTASRYGLEQSIGRAIQDSGVAREQLFVISRLWPTQYGFANAQLAFKESCQRLGLDYLDCYMLHFPDVPPEMTDECRSARDVRAETWRALELLLDKGLCRSIGVSNFAQTQLEELLEQCSVAPHVDQCEFHPFQNPVQLRSFLSDHSIQFMGYCPLGKGTLLHDPAIVQLAQQVGRTPAQVLIRWSIEQRVPCIPKSCNAEHLRSNTQVFDWSLSAAAMRQLGSLHDGRRLVDVEHVLQRLHLPMGYKLPPG